MQKTWQQTRDAALAAQAPEPILQQIETTLAAIAAAQAPLQTRQDTVLDLQSRVAGAVSRCGDVLAQIAQAQRSAVGGLLARDRRPLWKEPGCGSRRSITVLHGSVTWPPATGPISNNT